MLQNLFATFSIDRAFANVLPMPWALTDPPIPSEMLAFKLCAGNSLNAHKV